MPGVFRDRDGQYRYQTVNEYEERRRRALDDARSGHVPYRPSRLSQVPYDPPPAFVPALAPAPATWETVTQVPPFSPVVTAWPGQPSSGSVEAVAANDLLEMAAKIQARKDNAFFESLVSSPPPAQVGNSPLLDATFDAVAASGGAVLYQPIGGQLLAPSNTTVWAQDLFG